MTSCYINYKTWWCSEHQAVLDDQGRCPRARPSSTEIAAHEVSMPKVPIPESLTTQELLTRFTYRRPTGDQPSRYQSIRTSALALALTIRELCPDSRERSLALTELDACVMWANASIARRMKAVEEASPVPDPSAAAT